MGNYFLTKKQMAGGFADSYYYFLKYTMKQGLLMGLYKFLVGMAVLSEDDDMEEKVEFISEWAFESWGDDNYYYKTSKIIWTFLFDDGVCTNSDSSSCDYLMYYWEFIMTLNILITLPLSHVAAVYDWYSGWEEKIETVMGWME